MATQMPESGRDGEPGAVGHECGLTSVVIGAFIIPAVGIGFLLNWQVLLHARSTISSLDIRLGAVGTAVSVALLVWVAMTGLRLSNHAPRGLAAAGRTLNIVALAHLALYAINAAAIYHSLW
jgi:hypothetical protein